MCINQELLTAVPRALAPNLQLSSAAASTLLGVMPLSYLQRSHQMDST